MNFVSFCFWLSDTVTKVNERGNVQGSVRDFGLKVYKSTSQENKLTTRGVVFCPTPAPDAFALHLDSRISVKCPTLFPPQSCLPYTTQVQMAITSWWNSLQGGKKILS